MKALVYSLVLLLLYAVEWNVVGQPSAPSVMDTSITKSTPNDVTSSSITPSSSSPTSDSRSASWGIEPSIDLPSTRRDDVTSLTASLSHMIEKYTSLTVPKSHSHSASWGIEDSIEMPSSASSEKIESTETTDRMTSSLNLEPSLSVTPATSGTKVDSGSTVTASPTSTTYSVTSSDTKVLPTVPPPSSTSVTYSVTSSDTSVTYDKTSKPSVTPTVPTTVHTTIDPTTLPNHYRKPTITSKLEDIEKREGDGVFLMCEAVGNPEPSVRWLKDDKPTDYLLKRNPNNRIQQGYLYIEDTEKTDTGKYTCIAENAAGKDEKSLRVTILYLFITDIIISKYNDSTPIQKVTEGDDINLTCKAESRPRPYLSLRHNGRMIPTMQQSLGNRKYSIVTSMRDVKREVHAGLYNCSSTNAIIMHASKTKMLNIELRVPPTYPPLSELSKTSNTISIPIHNIPYLKNGMRTKYLQVIVMELQKEDIPIELSSKAKDPGLGPYKGNRRIPYIAGIFEVDEMEAFVIGDGKTYAVQGRKRRNTEKGDIEYHNAPLRPEKYYTACQRMVGTDDSLDNLPWIDPVKTQEDTPSYKDDNNNIIIYCVIALLVFLIIIVVIVGRVYVVKKQQSELIGQEKYEREMNGISPFERVARTFTMHMARISEHYHPPGSIPVDQFANHVTRMHKSGDMLFSTEYERIKDDPSIPATHSLSPENQWKNRFTNIVAYDHNRVKLTPYDDEPSSDYINANYIDGYQGITYIATQGPLDETCGDFWRMVWEQNTRVIVMLTNIRERGRPKCSQYWPSSGSSKFESAHISLVEEVELSSHTVRVFKVKMGEDKSRLIKQFHFTSWPDHGVPKSVAFLLSFIKTTSRANPADAGPMVVHCSAGVGRTGTFIVIDTMLRKIAAEKIVNIFQYVLQLRKQRNLMVQTEQQYVFIHDALFDAIVCGDTEITASKLRSRVQDLTEITNENDEPPLTREFQLLTRGMRPRLMSTAANHSVNKRKNRYHNTLPFDDTRVTLSVQSAVAGSDYINASFIDGYRKKRAYIATQAPLPESFSEFWRMVWEYGCNTIVTLAQELENDKPKMDRYWPTLHPITYGKLHVELLEEQKKESFEIRDFKITSDQDEASRTVRQYHFMDWTSDDVTDSEECLLSMINEINMWQMETGNHVITVHCSAGVGRTGVFCAVCLLIERLKAEALVDVFMTVKLLREQRPAMVQTKIQYQFCYKVLVEYLEMHSSLEQLHSPVDTIQTIPAPNKSPLRLSSHSNSSHTTFDPVDQTKKKLQEKESPKMDKDKCDGEKEKQIEPEPNEDSKTKTDSDDES